MGVLNGVNDICTAVDTNIRLLLGPNVDVQEARHPSLTFALELRGSGVIWSYGDYRKVGAGPLGDRGRQDFVWPFTVAVIGMAWNSPAGANKDARQMAELLMGSPSQALIPIGDREPNLRIIPLGTLGPDTLWLAFETQSPVLDPGGTPQAGRVAFIQQWVTDTQMRA